MPEPLPFDPESYDEPQKDSKSVITAVYHRLQGKGLSGPANTLRAETSRSTQFQLAQFHGRKHLSSEDGADSEAAEDLVERDQRR